MDIGLVNSGIVSIPTAQEYLECAERNHHKVIAQCGAEPTWQLWHGDCVPIARGIPDNSVDHAVTSIPFLSLYTYSPSERDMGNCVDPTQFFAHFDYLAREWLRITKPGRMASIHCMLVPTTLAHHGYVGMLDFRGDVIRAMTKAGWIFHTEYTIDKDPVLQQARTHPTRLGYGQLLKDSAKSGAGLADYLCVFRKPGDNAVKITHDAFPLEQWQRWARPSWKIAHTEEDECQWQKLAAPIWYDIDEGDTLNAGAKGDSERHLCPLQLPVIERSVELYSNKGEKIYDPFTGVGSTGVKAIEMGRCFFGTELNDNYYRLAARNIGESCKARQLTLPLGGNAAEAPQ